MSDTPSIRHLSTEQVRPGLERLDEFSSGELVDLMCADTLNVVDALARQRDALTAAVELVVERLERGGRVIYVGAGTAGRLGVLDAAETGPTFNVEAGTFIGVLAGGLEALETPREGAEDDEEAGRADLLRLAPREVDCVVGISASGRTPYVIAALAAGRELGCGLIGVACNLDTALGHAADVAIEVVVGPEVIAGSTRLNAGTVQKVALNIISTASMVRLGKTYGNLMVDMRPTNEKLRDRAVRIVMQITGAPEERARRALEEGRWRPKVAAAMLTGAASPADAASRLERHGGRLRPVLDELRREGNAAGRTNAAQRLGVRALLLNGQLVAGDVAIRDGIIEAIGLPGPGRGIAIPGLVDFQVNGYAGVDLLDDDADVDALASMSARLLDDGVIAFQPTLITSAPQAVERAAARLEEARRRHVRGARILGLHLEGPFLSSRRSGTHPTERLRLPDVELLARLLDASQVSTVTLAPELDGALELIDLCRRRGAAVFLGHSAATASQAERAFDAGAVGVTHLFNAMEPMSARSPGLAGAALLRTGVWLGLIADGVHVADELLRLAFAVAEDRCLLVSDAIAAARVDRTQVKLGEVTVTIADGVARRDDGTIAGSVAPLSSGLANLARLGVSTVAALNAVTWRPARLAHCEALLDLSPGRPANLFVLDEELRIERRVGFGDSSSALG